MGSSGNPFGMTNIADVPTYQNDLSKYQGYNDTGLAQGAMSQGMNAGANQMSQARAMGSAGNGGRGARNTNALSSGIGQEALNIKNQNEQQRFGQKLDQMQKENQFNLTNQGNQNAAYGAMANAVNGANANNSRQNGQLMQGILTAAMIACL